MIKRPNYTSIEIENIKTNYLKYIEEVNDFSSLKDIIEEINLKYKKLFDFRKKIFILFCIGLYNYLVALLSLYLLKEMSLFNIIMYNIPFFFVILFYASICEIIYNFISINNKDRIKNTIEKIKEKYKNNIKEKYDNDINKVNEIIEYNKSLKKLKSNYFKNIKSEIVSCSKSDYIKIIEDYFKRKDIKLYKAKYDDYYYANIKDKKYLILIKKENRTIAINELEALCRRIKKNHFDKAIIMYVGKISDNAVIFCNENSNKISLYDCEKLAKIITHNKFKNYKRVDF